MKVTCRGFTGELVNLERKTMPTYAGTYFYHLTIEDIAKKAEHVLKGVEPQEITFPGGEVSFGG